MNNDFTVRDFCTKDIVRILKIISKFGTENIKKVIGAVNFNRQNNRKAEYRKVGIFVAIELFGIAADRIPECEEEIYSFIASLTEKTAEEIANQPPVVTLRMIKAILNKDTFADFFTEASELFTSQMKD